MRLFSYDYSKFRHALTVASVLGLLILLPVVLLWSAGTAPASASKMAATAGSQCFPAAADSFVDEAAPETNYGEAEALRLKASETLARTYVRFDLSEIPEEATIEQALLRLYLQGSETSEVATVVRAAAEPWEEYGIYWDIQPERVGTFDERVHEAGEGYKEWNARELVAEWVHGGLPNYGLVVVPNDAPLYAEFAAREVGGDRVPLLCVEWSLPDTPTPVPPTPTSTPSPSCGKHLALRPDWGGKGAAVHATGCGWTPGADVDIVWDDPQGVLATTQADSDGNISVLFQLPATENEFPSPPGQHTVTATEPAGSMVATANFTQTARQLHLIPYRGPGTLTVDVRGCGWAGDPDPFLYWSGPPGDPPQNVGQIPIDPGSGCLEGSFDVPEHPAGIYQTVATTRSTYYTGTGSTASVFKIHYPYLNLTPPEGPPGSHLPIESCNWYPNEDVKFTWHPTGTLLTQWSTDGYGCVWSSSPSDADVLIPATATLGTHVVQATGVSSNLTATEQIEVMNPQLNLTPDHGLNGDSVSAYGCGWVGNDQVTIKWGYPDTNNQPIEWYGQVDTDTGCYHRVITVPTNTPAGNYTTTATGQDIGTATERFTVTHPGTVEVPDISSYAGYSLTVKGFDWIQGETVFYSWDEGPSQPFAGGGVTRADGRFTHTIQLPKYASVGGHSLTVTSTKGGDDSAGVVILDDAKIQMSNLLDVGTSPTVTGIDWAAGEQVTLELTDTNGMGWYFGSPTVPSDTLDFTQKITVGPSIPFGPATFSAVGDKGEDVTKSVQVTDTIAPTIVNVFQQPNPMPTNRTMQLYAKATDNDRYPDIIELAVGGRVEERCFNTTECRETGITLTAGTHNYTVTAYDDADNQTSKVGQVIAYRTDEAPTVTVSHTPFNPSGGQTIDVTAVVTDMQGGVKAMTITVGGRSPQTFNFTAPYPNTVTRHFHYKPQWLGQFGVKYHATVEDAGDLTTSSGPRWVLFDNNTGADSDNDGIDDSIELHFLCTDWNDPDSDEDSLRDGWEILGRHFSDGDSINLYKMGANPCRKDIFVQYDYERGTYIGDTGIQNVVNTFQDHNVTLHVDTNERPHTGSTTSPTSTLKAETASYQTDSNGNYYFDPKRNWTHKYIYSHHRQGRSSSWHYVTLDIYAGSNWNCPPSPDPTTNPQCNRGRRSPYDLQYRFIHELGHHLGMGHGGRGGSRTQKTNGDLVYYEGNWNNTNYKPHYVSVMNYRYSYNTGCYNASRNDWASDLDYQAANFGTLDENDLDERDFANASLFAFRSCGGSGYEPVVRYRCTDPDEGGKRYVMISNGTATLARKPASGSFTTTVPSQTGQGVDWDCDGTIESSVSENINTPLGEICGDNKDNNNNGATNEGCGKSKLRSPDDWNDIPTGRSCLGWKVQPKAYRNDITAPSCTSTLGISQDEVHTHDDEDFTLDPNTEVCNGYDTDGDGQIDEGCPDSDGDAIIDAIDNCPTVANADQANNDGDYRGAACEMPPSPPAGLSAEVTDAGIVLSWSAPDGGTPATGYNVYRRHHGDGGFRFVGEFPTTNSTSYTDTVENAGDYTYVVRAVNRYGEEGNRSEPATVNVTGHVYIPIVIR